MNYLCKYKNFFGEPEKGIHRYRIFNIAIVDVVVTLLFAYVISMWTHTPFLYTASIVFILGIIVHRLFCVRTTVDKWLFY